MSASLGQVQVVRTRDVWPHEAAAFTPWLAENLSALGDALGLDLELTATEAAVGNFSLDLLARDVSSGRTVVVENQFGSTNHDHLGKLLTYAAGLEAGDAIWIAEELRDEHRETLEWLNRITESSVNFFGVVVEVIRIDDSRPAVQFRAVVTPNRWQRMARDTGGAEISEKGEAYQRFFQVLVDELREKHHFTGVRTAQPQNWCSFSSQTRGVLYSTCFSRGEQFRIELYIDRRDDADVKALFDRLHAEKDAIEREFGGKLSWERLDDRRASRIAAYRAGSIRESEAELADIRQWAVRGLLRFKEIFGPRLQRLG